jgi:hypothetical protein
MPTRALLYAGFLTAALAVLLASSRLRGPGADTIPPAPVAENR